MSFVTYQYVSVTHVLAFLHRVSFNYNPFCRIVLQVHLITKIIYETLSADFNNTMHVITKIICVNNKLGFYVALTLFWALYLNYFKKDSHHYYKMYNADKFFKLLLNNEPFKDNQDADSMFKLLLLISIYQNYVILNKENAENHQVFQEFFRVTHNDREKLKSWLINVKALIEVNNPLVKPNQSSDVLMVSEKRIRRVHKRVQHHFSCVTQLEDTNGWLVGGGREQGCYKGRKESNLITNLLGGIEECRFVSWCRWGEVSNDELSIAISKILWWAPVLNRKIMQMNEIFITKG